MGKAYTSTATITRPANTDAYADGDTVANSCTVASYLTFTKVARAKGGSSLLKAVTIIDSSAQATQPDYELWLFDSPPTGVLDDAAFSLSDADALKVLTVVDVFDVYLTGNGLVLLSFSALDSVLQTAQGTNAIYGILVVRNAYTPTSAEVITVKLQVDMDV